MKTKERLLRALAAGISAAVLFTGCGAPGGSSASDSPSSKSTQQYNGGTFADSYSPSYAETGDMMGGGYAEEGKAVAEDTGTFSSSGADDLLGESNRKLIRTARLEVETKEFEPSMSSLEDQVRELGGYIENMDIYNGSRYSGDGTKYADLTLRIPEGKLEGFLDSVSRLCNVVRRSDSVEDVTLTYVDMESHRDALRTEQTRLLELLEKAENLEDILTIEERLTNVRYRLESMESSLRTIDNQVEYSTVHLKVSEVKELTPAAEETIWQRISEGFLGSLGQIGHGAAEVCIWLLVNLPHLIIWAALTAAIVLIIRRNRRKRAEKKAADFQKAKEAGAAGRQIMDK